MGKRDGAEPGARAPLRMFRVHELLSDNLSHDGDALRRQSSHSRLWRLAPRTRFDARPAAVGAREHDVLVPRFDLFGLPDRRTAASRSQQFVVDKSCRM